MSVFPRLRLHIMSLSFERLLFLNGVCQKKAEADGVFGFLFNAADRISPTQGCPLCVSAKGRGVLPLNKAAIIRLVIG